MKVKVTEQQLRRILAEDLNQVNQQPGQSATFISTLTDPNVMKKANDNLSQLSALKKKADDIIMKEEEPAVRMEIEDHIDELLLSEYGFTYFKDKTPAPSKPVQTAQPSLFPNKQAPIQQVPCFQTFPDDKKVQMMSKYPTLKLIQAGKLPEAMNSLLREKQKNMNESLVGSETFRIIAEAETPKLSKAELLDYIKKHAK